MITLDLNKSAGVLDLNKAAPSFKTIRGLLNWEPSPIHAKSLTQGFDLDIFAFVLDTNSKISAGTDVIYFNNQNYAGNAIQLSADNRTGEGADDEYIDMKLDTLPTTKSHVDIFVFIHDAAQRNQTFGMMANSSFVVSDVENKTDLVKYELSKYTNETAIHIGRFSRSASGWEFAPSGEVASADPNTVVAAYM